MKRRITLSIAFSLCIGLLALVSFNSAALGQQDAKGILPNVVQADLRIKQFHFPPSNDKALRVHVVNTGQSPSKACRLVLTVRKINGVAVGRKTRVNVPALAAGALAAGADVWDIWLVIDAKGLLPNKVSLQSTTFKLNVDATKIVAESDEGNNEVWHGLAAEAVPSESETTDTQQQSNSPTDKEVFSWAREADQNLPVLEFWDKARTKTETDRNLVRLVRKGHALVKRVIDRGEGMSAKEAASYDAQMRNVVGQMDKLTAGANAGGVSGCMKGCDNTYKGWGNGKGWKRFWCHVGCIKIKVGPVGVG
jgi:CARDB